MTRFHIEIAIKKTRPRRTRSGLGGENLLRNSIDGLLLSARSLAHHDRKYRVLRVLLQLLDEDPQWL